VPDHPPEDPGAAPTTELVPAAARTEVQGLAGDGLPGLEPERDVTDWGRSARVSAVVDASLIDFLYHYWFRVEAEGLDNVPARGGALLIANRAGALRLDAPMIMRAVREEHGAARAVHVAAPSSAVSRPGIGMLATKLGAVSAHPANLHRLLLDEEQLVLAFPEASAPGVKPLRSRYRLRPFDALPFVEIAIRAGAPIVPVALVGSEEATPALGSLLPIGPLRARTRLSAGLPLPAKFRLRFLQPVRTDEIDKAPSTDRGRPAELVTEIRGLIQENLLEMVAERRSVWLG